MQPKRFSDLTPAERRAVDNAQAATPAQLLHEEMKLYMVAHPNVTASEALKAVCALNPRMAKLYTQSPEPDFERRR